MRPDLTFGKNKVFLSLYLFFLLTRKRLRPSEISRYCGPVENFYLDFLSVYIEILQIKTLF